MLRRIAVGLLPLGLACASPTLPLPPPELPTIEEGTDADHIRLVAGCGAVEGNALVVVLNTNPAVPGDEQVSGAVASACGAWDTETFAHSGDVLDITQEFGTIASTPTIVQVP